MQILKMRLALIGLISCILIETNDATERLEGDKSTEWSPKYLMGMTGAIVTPKSRELQRVREHLHTGQDEGFLEAIALIKQGCYSLISNVFARALELRKFNFIEQLDKWSNEKFNKNIVKVLEMRKSVPVWWAAAHASPQELKWVLERASKESVNKGIAGESSPLHRAAEADGDKVERVIVLVEHGANTFNKPGFMGATPLAEAIIAGNVEIASYLLQCMKDRGLSIDEKALYEVVCRETEGGTDYDSYLEYFEPANYCWNWLRKRGHFDGLPMELPKRAS